MEIVAIHFLISLILMLVVADEWGIRKVRIASNGWDLENCTPFGEIELAFYFLPVINLLFTYFSLRLTEELSQQKNRGQTVDVYLGKLGVHYQDN